VQLVGLTQAGVAAGDNEARMDVGVQGGDGGGVQILVVDQENVIVGMPAVLVAPPEFQGDHMPGDPELALEPLPEA
jgi:hypothetical protein